MAQPVTARDWRLVGGRLSLDFVNTVVWRGSARRRTGAATPARLRQVEKLIRFDDLLSWAAAAGAVTPAEAGRMRRAASRQPRQAARALAQAIGLREALHRVVSAVVDGRTPGAPDLDVLNRALATARAHERLTATRGRFALTWDEAATLDRPLWPIARDASGLLASARLDRVRRCGGEDCGWFFLDTTRNHSRQWCDMRDCGNLAKVRRFRERARRLARTTSRSART